MAQLETVIIRPLITEKATKTTEKTNRYGFVVALSSNKNQIKKAVEKLYDVRVLSVKTSIVPGRTKRAGMRFKKTNKMKKAFVQLENGQKIELFKGV